MTATTTIAVAMKIAVATIERGDSRAIAAHAVAGGAAAAEPRAEADQQASHDDQRASLPESAASAADGRAFRTQAARRSGRR